MTVTMRTAARKRGMLDTARDMSRKKLMASTLAWYLADIHEIMGPSHLRVRTTE